LSGQDREANGQKPAVPYQLDDRLKPVPSVAAALEPGVDHETDEDHSALRARLGNGVVVDVSGEREQQGETDQFVVGVHRERLGGLAPHVRVGQRLQVRRDEALLLGRDRELDAFAVVGRIDWTERDHRGVIRRPYGPAIS
jgi:hypothetical protein